MKNSNCMRNKLILYVSLCLDFKAAALAINIIIYVKLKEIRMHYYIILVMPN